MFTVPSLDKFTENEEDHRIPGQIIFGGENLILNPGRRAISLRVVNKGDRPIQVFAYVLHLAAYHFFFFCFKMINSFFPYKNGWIMFYLHGVPLFLNSV